jgi:hypothetical protein
MFTRVIITDFISRFATQLCVVVMLDQVDNIHTYSSHLLTCLSSKILFSDNFLITISLLCKKCLDGLKMCVGGA